MNTELFWNSIQVSFQKGLRHPAELRFEYQLQELRRLLVRMSDADLKSYISQQLKVVRDVASMRQTHELAAILLGDEAEPMHDDAYMDFAAWVVSRGKSFVGGLAGDWRSLLIRLRDSPPERFGFSEIFLAPYLELYRRTGVEQMGFEVLMSALPAHGENSSHPQEQPRSPSVLEALHGLSKRPGAMHHPRKAGARPRRQRK